MDETLTAPTPETAPETIPGIIAPGPEGKADQAGEDTGRTIDASALAAQLGITAPPTTIEARIAHIERQLQTLDPNFSPLT